ncbi:hypothetical protein BDA96_01G149600 [Sorghum bicolor]|uniref:Uncharacterized protein n=2 Tax=Sorghum bicolor TaxID=4558 RepID=A0A921RYR1_SORBI|nr:hypothetical protein SORBI_3001G142700 [Sorghum bicolor]KAG0548236.1 hypothetical protein BDA96_01G149600 [Sorghum bicolor]
MGRQKIEELVEQRGRSQRTRFLEQPRAAITARKTTAVAAGEGLCRGSLGWRRQSPPSRHPERQRGGYGTGCPWADGIKEIFF